jgi:hypothetical protein
MCNIYVVLSAERRKKMEVIPPTEGEGHGGAFNHSYSRRPSLKQQYKHLVGSVRF